MPDLRIRKGKYLSTVSPLNESTKRWILNNIARDNINDTRGVYTISNDSYEDVIKDYEEKGFEVEWL